MADRQQRADETRSVLTQLDASATEYATQFVNALLAAARQLAASDVHVQPCPEGLDVAWRLDGVLQTVGRFPRGAKSDVIARLKVMAELLTYRNDVPQEGRIRSAGQEVEMRVSTFPTLHGERAVVRLFAAEGRFLHLEDLGLPAELTASLGRLLAETSGAIVVSGPAGTGKTTTVYACLREIVRGSGGQKCVVSLEDPIEMRVDGVAQSQVNEAGGFSFASGLRSLMRQDPEVILLGEIRDRITAETAFQAALTGHLLLTTFHAGSAAGAISRLADMGIEPYLLRSGILAIVSQRLVRRLCSCARECDDPAQALGLPVPRFRLPVGCEQCHGTGYHGRMILAEMLQAECSDLGRAILDRSDTGRLEQLAIQAGMVTRWQRALEAVQAGMTSPQEIRRVLGFSHYGDVRGTQEQENTTDRKTR
ncbi:MAG TPA: GspE/PulE family protein [Candidatus Anammoximicrobium sp.]|nr:GspE/PulE family protein [Candidatus Anammoximicrobium sp.]